MMSDDIAIKISDVHVSFGNHHVLKGASGEIKKGSIVTFLGRNGCGKSTLLKVVTGNLKPENGSIEIEGRTLSSFSASEMAQKVAFLPQVHEIPRDMTTEELVACGRYPYQHWWTGVSEHDREIIELAMEKTNTIHLKNRIAANLSGGERQRVWIAMALAQEPEILILDEPTTYLDICHQLEVLELIEKLNQDEKLTVVMVLHDINQAIRYSQDILVLEALAIFLFVGIAEQAAPSSWDMLFMVLKKGSIYALIGVSMNLLNGFTGLFSLGQAGFMLLGAYTYGIFTIPVADRASVYQYFDGGLVQFTLPVPIALILAGLVAAAFAFLIGLPVLRLKSDYLAIATLGFAEIIRAIFQWNVLGPITNGSNLLRKFPVFHSTIAYFLVVGLCVAVILLLINSSYGRAFKAIREDEIAAEAMGINLSRTKMLSFCISSFFAGIGGALLAMYQTSVQAAIFKSAMTYEILLIVVIGGIGSISGSCIAAFLYVAASEWWLRFLDTSVTFTSPTDPRRIAFIAVFSVVVLGGGLLLILREQRHEKKRWKQIAAAVVALALMGWLISYLMSGSMAMPFLRNGFRMVAFSLVIMIVVLFFRQGLMGDKELPDLFKRRRKEAHQ